MRDLGCMCGTDTSTIEESTERNLSRTNEYFSLTMPYLYVEGSLFEVEEHFFFLL